MLEAAQKSGFGAQFGGKHFALDVRVIRMPRHGASCPVGMGVSCSAHRNVKAKINKDGLWIEELERNPGRFIPEKYREAHKVGMKHYLETGEGPVLGKRVELEALNKEGKVFPIEAKLGTAEEWTFVNMTPFPRPMHVHVNPFQAVSVNSEPVPGRPWMDTMIVPAAGVATIRTRFEDFDGDFVMHCHILPHEDAGMMMNVRIVA